MGWNINSLSDYKTQVKFINKLKGLQENLFILCDTRLNCDSQRVFGKLWGEGAYFNSFSSSQRGLTILFKDSLPAREVNINNLIKGNYTRLTFKVKNLTVLVKAIYAPNEDMTKNDVDNYSNTFFKTVFNDEDDDNFDIKAIVGDFNVAPKHKMDTAGYLHINNQNTRNFLDKMIPLCNLTDIWRQKNHKPDNILSSNDKQTTTLEPGWIIFC